jgi:hypothetical protein
MPGILSGVFGEDQENTNQQSSDLTSDLDAAAGVDASNDSYSQEVDDDGSSETNASSQDFGADADAGSLIDSASDSMSSSESDDGGLLG